MSSYSSNQRGSFAIGLMIFLMIFASIILGFVVGALTDPRRSSDVRASAYDPSVKPVFSIGEKETCANPIRWYSIDLICK